MLLTSRIQSAELIVEENGNGSQGGNPAIPLFFSVCPLSSKVNNSSGCPSPLSERDVGRLTTNVGHENARKERGLPGLDHQPIHQKLPSSPSV